MLQPLIFFHCNNLTVKPASLKLDFLSHLEKTLLRNKCSLEQMANLLNNDGFPYFKTVLHLLLNNLFIVRPKGSCRHQFARLRVIYTPDSF